MRLMSAQHASLAPSVGRMLLLTAVVSLCLVLSSGGVGAQSVDDHGNFFSTATPLSLGSPVAGRISPGDDRDYFRLDLSSASGVTDVWIYTTGDVDTFGGLFDGNGKSIIFNNDSFIEGTGTNFHLRRNLSAGIYHVGVSSIGATTGDYTLHAQSVTNPGGTTDTATLLNLDSPTPGTIDATGDADYFRLDFTESTNLLLYVKNLVLYDANANPLPIASLNGQVFDSTGSEISANIYHDLIGIRIEAGFDPGTYYIKVTTLPVVTSHPVPYTIYAFEDTDYTQFIDVCQRATDSLNNPLINDPLYGCQWHLNNSDGEDINVEAVWAEGISGEGVNIAVVDDGMDYTHADLRDNIDTSRNHDYTGSGNIHHPLEYHGTNVAGVIAARGNNGIGVRGVAHRATMYGYNYLRNTTDLNRADAMTRNGVVTAVSNNSWAPPNGPGLGHAHSMWYAAVSYGVRTGYNDKGTFYVKSGGNGHLIGDNSNLDEYANFFGVTAVCAVNDHDTRSAYSEMGANLWVCAPSGDFSQGYRGIVTTENNDRYEDYYSGTSTATAVVSGVAALMRSANPDLTWRDLKLILAASSRKNDAGNSGWEDGARKYRSGFDTDRYHFSHEYGFGVVDVKAAVDLAKRWRNLPPLQSSVAESSRLDVLIPDAPVAGDPTTVTRTLTLDTGIGFTEFVEVTVSFQHLSFRDLEIQLESPSGRISKLAVPFNTFADDDSSTGFVSLYGTFQFGSARHLGEDPNGVWKLRVTDRLEVVDGTLDSWSVIVYGHVRTLDPPTIDSVTAGAGSLTVAWTAPSQTAGQAVTAYDLRHVQTAIDETVESNWTVVEDIWTAAPGGALEYTITGLAGGTQYDVQVRAVNAVGDGPWSNQASATVPVNELPVFTEGAKATRLVAENSAKDTNIGMPIVAGDADDDTLTYTLGGSDAALFAIDSGTGQIRVGDATTLDYETKTIYSVDVSAADPYGATAMIAVTIMVTNMDEEGTVTLSTEDPRVGTAITATLTDPDGIVSGTMWQWARSSDGSTWTDITEATDTTYTPVAADEGNYLRATASYTDGEGSGKREDAVTANAVDSTSTTGSVIGDRYDADDSGAIEKSEVFAAINDYLDGVAGAPTKADVFKLINLYLGD